MAHRTFGTSVVRSLIFGCIVSFIPAIGFAQITNVTNDQATPKLDVGHDYIGELNEIVSPSNGSVSVRINVPTPSGRGLSFPFSFDYNSNGTIVLTPQGTQGFNVTIGADSGFGEKPGGWRYGLPVLGFNLVNIPSRDPNHPGYCSIDTGFVFTDSASSRSALSLSLANVTLCGSMNIVPQTFYTANNDSFYKAWTQNGAVDASVPFYVTNASGTLFHFPFLLGYGCIRGCNVPDYIEDRNGNKVTLTENPSTGFPLTVKDTTGRTLLSMPGFGNSGDTVSVSGDSAPYTVQWQTAPTSFTIGTGPQLADPSLCSASNQFPGGPGMKVISSITLPNGKKYQFFYDATYGLLSKILYPNGGYVRYTWGVNTQSDMVYWYDSFGNFPGCEVRYSPPAISHRYVSYDGVNVAQQQDFTYFTNWASPTNPTWTYKTTTVKTTDFLTPGNPVTYTIYTYSPR